MKKNFILFILLITSVFVKAQILEPITWEFTTKEISDKEVELIFKAKIENGWHLYGMTLPAGGPSPTTFSFNEIIGAKLVGKVTSQREPIYKIDPQFDMELNWFDSNIDFVQKIEITGDEYNIQGEIKFMGCNDETCLPPTPEEFSFSGKKSNTSSAAVVNSDKADTDTVKEVILPEINNNNSTSEQTFSTDLWAPVIEKLNAFEAEPLTSKDTSLWIILLTGFLGGLFALLTPCVWPMIPMTVSFFLKRTKNRKKSIRDAVTYGVSIIVIYVALGLVITGLFGASALNDLATNAIFNIIFFLLLIVFAVSFLGAFEITLPASWTTKLDSKADSTTGLLSIFFMAFTLALVSFSCTGPIIGTLLVQAASMGATAGPAIGMFGFALALALPFSLFAIFPSMLQSMPKSGGWLNSVKVVLGFLELALALKFLSVADLAYGWRILDREVFVTLWIVIFALLGFYLLGKLKFSHDSDITYISIPRLGLAIVSLAFSIYMIPGLWGAPLKAISAFAPPLTTQDFNLYNNEVHAQFTDYEEGMAYAKKVNKPVLIDFSGYGCVNCRKMEASVWTNDEVKSIIEKDYVLITLIVDEKTSLAEPIVINEYGKKRTLRTVGDKWSYLQRSKFGANAQPFYVLLNDKGEPIAPKYSFNKNVNDYINFLNTGLKNFK
ncbi:MAG: cytochrome c biogenesis protein CcdA [Bacteroidales bacterium]|nr:cytochrome c biogenesis protein CcdA [Bacteroidales bacterium]